MGPQSGQQPTRKAPDSNRNRRYAAIPPSCGPTFRTRFYREPVRRTCQRAEIEARDDGRDRLAQSGVIWGTRARERQRGRPLDSGPVDGGWLATGEEPAASAVAVSGTNRE
jgi:hypothetical protein